jgi:hypothetical protein
VFNIEDVLCTFCFDILCFIFIYLCTFFAFFASADRRSRYIRYRDNVGDTNMVKAITLVINNSPQKLFVLPNTQILGIGSTP